MSRLTSFTALALAASTLAGCPTSTPFSLEFMSLTSPPPFAVADLEDDGTGHATIALSKGVAIAFTCLTPDSVYCTGVRGTLDDPSLALVEPAYVAGYDPGSTLVLVGKEPGETVLEIATDQGPAKIAVTVAAQ